LPSLLLSRVARPTATLGRGKGLRTGHDTRIAALRFSEVLADFKGQAQFGKLIRHRERAAGLRLDAMQTMPDRIGMAEELRCGIGDRALVGGPRSESLE
jgi:hypothetical protein